MKKSFIFGLWAVLYCICMGLGFVGEAEGFGKLLLVLSGILFFLPPYYLIYLARKEKSRRLVLALRLISGGVLLLTLILLILNFLSVYFSSQAGLVLYVLLVMGSVPMVCCQYWALGLFLWAVLLILTFCKFNESSPSQR